MAVPILTHRDAFGFAAVRAAIAASAAGIVNLAVGVALFGADRSINAPFDWVILALVGTGAIGSLIGAGIFGYRSALAMMELSLARAELSRLSRTDLLTGLLNRRGFNEAAALISTEAKRISHPIAVWMCDIDRFKRINDTIGHEFGDEVLVKVGDALSSLSKDHNLLIARHGGEEFIAMKITADIEEAKKYAEAFRLACAMNIATENGAIDVTVSVGCALSIGVFDLSKTIGAADKALYAAKNGGRNRIAWADADRATLAPNYDTLDFDVHQPA